MNIFELKGAKWNFRGQGKPDGTPETTRKFTLKQGAMVVRVEHPNTHEFELKFAGNNRRIDTRNIVRATRRGALIGTAFGGPVGGVTAAAAGALARALRDRENWIAETADGRLEIRQAIRVAEDKDADLKPGEYQIEVLSRAPWNCEFIQPDVGQATGKFANDDEAEHKEGLREPGLHILPPLLSDKRPTLATIRHTGAGKFFALALSVDGTHKCEIHSETGQFYTEERLTEIKPGKEYILMVEASGEWRVEFTEGY